MSTIQDKLNITVRTASDSHLADMFDIIEHDGIRMQVTGFGANGMLCITDEKHVRRYYVVSFADFKQKKPIYKATDKYKRLSLHKKYGTAWPDIFKVAYGTAEYPKNF